MPDVTTIFNIAVDPALIPDQDLEPLLAALSNLEPVLEEWATIQQEAQEQNFADEGVTFGDPWPELRYSTLMEKRRIGASAEKLVRTGRLQESIGQTVLLTPDSVTVGIDLSQFPTPYPQYLNNRFLLVAVTDEEEQQMVDTLRSYIAEATGGSLSGITITSENE